MQLFVVVQDPFIITYLTKRSYVAPEMLLSFSDVIDKQLGTLTHGVLTADVLPYSV